MSRPVVRHDSIIPVTRSQPPPLPIAPRLVRRGLAASFVLLVAAAAVAIGFSGWAAANEPVPPLARGLSPLTLPKLAAPAPAPSTEQASASSACPEGMLPVEGEYCPYVGHRCLEWIDEKRDRCKRYDPKPICEGRIEKRSFCIDRYEYPNEKGVYPAVMVSYIDAEQACKAEGKRLCTSSEWTFACEGEEKRPYPYGAERDATACNIDRPYRLPDMQAFSYDQKISSEVERLDQRVPSGSMDRCVSPFGVQDMTGNVDEWVVNERPDPEKNIDVSGLKGGYFGPIRARCRPMTNSHNRWFRFYQVGFRCCADAP
jgi:formylglycine-generating enzyme